MLIGVPFIIMAPKQTFRGSPETDTEQVRFLDHSAPRRQLQVRQLACKVLRQIIGKVTLKSS
jgi:hypothetical protein